MWRGVVFVSVLICCAQVFAAPKAAKKPAMAEPQTQSDAQSPLTKSQEVQSAKVEAEADGLTEDEAVLRALRINPNLRAFRRQRGVAEGQVVTASMITNPAFQLQLVHVQTGADMGAAATLKWAPPQPIVYAANRSLARAHLEQVDHEIAEQEWLIQNQVRSTYSLLLMLKKQLAVCEQMIGLRKRVLELYKTRLSHGGATRIELNQVQLSLLAIERDRDALLLRQVDAQSDLRTQIGEVTASPVKLRGAFPVDLEHASIPSADALAEQALAARPALKAAHSKIIQRQHALRAERAKAWPWFEISARYRHTTSTNYPDEVLLGIEIPLPVLNQNQGPIQEAAAQVDLALGLAEAQFLILKQSVFNAYAALQVRRSVLLRYEREVLPILAEHEQLLELSLRGGQIDLVTLLAGEETALRAQRDYFDARLAFRIAWLALQAAVGQPLEESRS
ncbi:MAG TPA: TolC family protein [Pseudomonadota bacterium]|nr:TolC family protein [Pseudomonadota bacterium]